MFLEMFHDGSFSITGVHATYFYEKLCKHYHDMPSLEQVKRFARENACEDVLANRPAQTQEQVQIDTGYVSIEWTRTTRGDMTLWFVPTQTIGESTRESLHNLGWIYRQVRDGEVIYETTPLFPQDYIKQDIYAPVFNVASLC